MNNLTIESDKLIFPSNKIRSFFAFILTSAGGYFLYTISVDIENTNFMYYFLMTYSFCLEIIAILYIAALFLNRPRIEVDLKGIKIVGLIKVQYLNWNEINIYRQDFKPTIFIDCKDKFFPISVFPPPRFSSRDFYNFLSKLKLMILNKQIYSAKQMHDVLCQIKEEHKSQKISDSKNRILLKFPMLQARYASGIIFCSGMLCFLLQSRLFYEFGAKSLSISLALIVIVSLMSSMLLYYSYIVVYYDKETKIGYRGYCFAGKITKVKKIIENIRLVTVVGSSGRLSLHWVAFSSQGNELFCKLFVTKYSARKFQEKLANLLNLEIDDSYFGIPSSSESLNLLNKGLNFLCVVFNIFTFFILALPYIMILILFFHLMGR